MCVFLPTGWELESKNQSLAPLEIIVEDFLCRFLTPDLVFFIFLD